VSDDGINKPSRRGVGGEVRSDERMDGTLRGPKMAVVEMGRRGAAGSLYVEPHSGW